MRAIYLMLLLLGIGFAESALAIEVEKFFMPGELISSHDEFKSDCKNCHVRMRDTTQRELCLGCHDHEPVALDIRNKKGFHGKRKLADRSILGNPDTVQRRKLHRGHRTRRPLQGMRKAL